MYLRPFVLSGFLKVGSTRVTFSLKVLSQGLASEAQFPWTGDHKSKYYQICMEDTGVCTASLDSDVFHSLP